VIVRFVDIDGIAEHHCLKILFCVFVVMIRYIMYQGDSKFVFKVKYNFIM